MEPYAAFGGVKNQEGLLYTFNMVEQPTNGSSAAQKRMEVGFEDHVRLLDEACAYLSEHEIRELIVEIAGSSLHAASRAHPRSRALTAAFSRFPLRPTAPLIADATSKSKA